MISRRAFFGMAAAIAVIPLAPKTVIASEVVIPRSAVANQFKSIIIPMIRKIIPGMIARNIAGVQPMTSPAGSIFALRYVYRRPFFERILGLKRR